jgi:hypothetical protein
MTWQQDTSSVLKKPLEFEFPLQTTANDVTVKLEKLIKLIATNFSSAAGKLPEGARVMSHTIVSHTIMSYTIMSHTIMSHTIMSHTITASTQKHYKFSLQTN